MALAVIIINANDKSFAPGNKIVSILGIEIALILVFI